MANASQSTGRQVKTEISGLEGIHRHAIADIRVLNHLGKFLEADATIAVEICFHDGLVDNLLQLLVLQVLTHHHLEHNEQLAVGNVSVAVNVVDLEREPQLLLLVALAAERAQARHELLEVNVATAVFVKDSNQSVCCARRKPR